MSDYPFALWTELREGDPVLGPGVLVQELDGFQDHATLTGKRLGVTNAPGRVSIVCADGALVERQALGDPTQVDFVEHEGTVRWTARFRLDGTRIAQRQLPAVLPLLPLALPDRRRVLARLDWIHGDFETLHEVEDVGQLCVTQGMLVGLGGGRDGRPSQLVHIGSDRLSRLPLDHAYAALLTDGIRLAARRRSGGWDRLELDGSSMPTGVDHTIGRLGFGPEDSWIAATPDSVFAARSGRTLWRWPRSPASSGLLDVDVVGERVCMAHAGGTVLHARSGEVLARRVADLPLTSRVASNEAIFWSDDELIHRVA